MRSVVCTIENCGRITPGAILVSVACFLVSVGNATEHDRQQAFLSATIKSHCIKCHGDQEEVAGGVRLDAIDRETLVENAELVQSLIDVLEGQEMPPEDEPDLEGSDRSSLINQLKTIRDDSVSQNRSFGRSPIRRMNRFQYNNAVVDLFELRCVVFTLPERMMREHKNYFQPASGKMADVVKVGSRPLGKSQLIEPRLAGVAAFPQDLRAEHGFDNRGDHLSMSPLLMEAFLTLGQSITQSADFHRTQVGIWDSFFAPPKKMDYPLEEVRSRLDRFLTRAFRRPVDAETLNRYVAFAGEQLSSGKPFTDVMKSIAAATIASPRFLYLYERNAQSRDDPSVQDHAEEGPLHGSSDLIDDLELASRLSFFLWGSIPDRELLDLAVAGKLRHRDQLAIQVDRMLKDRKLKRFCDSFPTQWLQMERIISSVPNQERFPNFYFAKYRLSMHMMLEPLLVFETVLVENRPVTQLIDSDFTYRSSLLESAYGELASEALVDAQVKKTPTAIDFVRVPVTDRRNGGVITSAAVMTMTSGPERTQPITRGAWVASVIFNNPPEPPPADVPALDEKPPEGEEHLTLRERLSMHRKRADCKGCHEQIDPLGFALENYGPIGTWRDQYDNGRDIDVGGKLIRKHDFGNVAEFKDAILAEKDRFTRGLGGHLLSFALARGLSPADETALDQIAETTATDGYKIQTLMKQVVLSEPFHRKNNPMAPALAESISNPQKVHP